MRRQQPGGGARPAIPGQKTRRPFSRPPIRLRSRSNRIRPGPATSPARRRMRGYEPLQNPASLKGSNIHSLGSTSPSECHPGFPITIEKGRLKVCNNSPQSKVPNPTGARPARDDVLNYPPFRRPFSRPPTTMIADCERACASTIGNNGEDPAPEGVICYG